MTKKVEKIPDNRHKFTGDPDTQVSRQGISNKCMFKIRGKDGQNICKNDFNPFIRICKNQMEIGHVTDNNQ